VIGVVVRGVYTLLEDNNLSRDLLRSL
jgi:hypothetical protein